MHRQLPLRAAAFALPLLLAACIAGLPAVGPTIIERYDRGSAGLFAAAGQLEVIGTAATPAERDRLAEVAATNIPRGSLAPAPFTLTPRGNDDPQRQNRVVLVIGGGAGFALCDDPPAHGGRFGGGSVTVAAAACNGETLLTSTQGQIAGIDGVDDPRLAELFRQIGAELFPPRNPNYEDNDRGDFDS